MPLDIMGGFMLSCSPVLIEKCMFVKQPRKMTAKIAVWAAQVHCIWGIGMNPIDYFNMIHSTAMPPLGFQLKCFFNRFRALKNEIIEVVHIIVGKQSVSQRLVRSPDVLN